MTTPTQNILKLLEESLPPCFPRKRVHELTFGLVNPRTLANRDSEKTGPAGLFLGSSGFSVGNPCQELAG